MIILDTNVVSEPMKSGASPAVLAWLDKQAAETLYLTTTSLAELLLGIAILPGGKRKDGLENALSRPNELSLWTTYISVRPGRRQSLCAPCQSRARIRPHHRGCRRPNCCDSYGQWICRSCTRHPRLCRRGCFRHQSVDRRTNGAIRINRPNNGQSLDIQISHTQRIILNELATRFDVVAHQPGEQTVGIGGVVDLDLQQ